MIALLMMLAAQPALSSDDVEFDDAAANALYAPRPMIEVGAGGMADPSGWGFLLRTRLRVVDPIAPADPEDPVKWSEQWIWAEFTGEGGIVPTADASELPYLSLRFVPIAREITFENTIDGVFAGGAIELLPTELSRQVSLGQAANLEVALVGARFGTESGRDELVRFFLDLSVDALGYKFVDQLSSSFHGAHLIDFGVSGGIGFQVTEEFGIRLALGGAADLAAGTGGLQSDLLAYFQLSARLAQVAEVFARVAYQAAWNGVEDRWSGAPIFVFGVALSFE
ncbi:MAG: hypothetical protein IT285_12230 [Bdellovibrionales bacterium]|nr:hypothetical protein [Bdellovibrionales bacterium]